MLVWIDREFQIPSFMSLFFLCNDLQIETEKLLAYLVEAEINKRLVWSLNLCSIRSPILLPFTWLSIIFVLLMIINMSLFVCDLCDAYFDLDRQPCLSCTCFVTVYHGTLFIPFLFLVIYKVRTFSVWISSWRVNYVSYEWYNLEPYFIWWLSWLISFCWWFEKHCRAVFAFSDLKVNFPRLCWHLKYFLVPFDRKKAHTRERSSMPSATFLVTKLVDRYHQNLTVIMHMYVDSVISLCLLALVVNIIWKCFPFKLLLLTFDIIAGPWTHLLPYTGRRS